MKVNVSFLFLLVLASAHVAAQAPPVTPSRAPAQSQTAQPKTPPARDAQASEPARPGEVETAPIRCWWKTDTAEIRVGQRFGLTLTCSVIETRSLKVIPGTNQLDPGAIQLTPFEVVSGTRREDIVSPPWRYFQFEYRVRLLSEGFFGQDVNIPSLNVTYNIQAAAGGGAQGRDQTYVLPALPMRVASLVPRDASDIRDASTDGFAVIGEREYRATSARVAAGILFALAAVLAVFGVVRALGGVRRRRPDAVRVLSPALVLHGSQRALAALKADVIRDGWSPSRARAALTALRAAGAVGLSRPLAQSSVSRTTIERDGQLKVRHGVLRPRWSLVSGAVTPHAIDAALSESTAFAPATRAALERISSALRAFGTAGYGRSDDVDTIALDAALSESSDAVKRLRWRSVWPRAAANGRAQAQTLGAPSMSGERL